jgi:hypothetical protein
MGIRIRPDRDRRRRIEPPTAGPDDGDRAVPRTPDPEATLVYGGVMATTEQEQGIE